MSMTDSDFSHGEYRTFRQVSHDRLLHEMVRSSKANDSKASWKVLIMDKFTLKVMSYSCKMADITNEGVSLVEDLFKRRQPMPAMDAVYFIQPSKENVIMFLSDMSGRCPLYKKAYVFFSSPIPKELVSHIKMDTSVIPRIGALGEMNLEYFAIDSQGFITDHEMALGDIYGENAEKSHKYNACFSIMATRIATAFASLKEFPSVRYRAAKSSSDASTPTALHDRVPSKLAAEVWNCITKYKTSVPDFPQKETCDLLIVDRPIDQLAKLSHDDMNTVNNMKHLGGSDAKKTSVGSFSLKFDAHKIKHAARKERADEEEQWQLSRFYPMLELREKLSKGESSFAKKMMAVKILCF